MKSFSKSFCRRSGKSGFTIIELLVALGVTILLVTLMLTIITNVLNGWNRSAGVLSTGNQARVVLDQLAQDFQAAIIKRDSNVWMAVSVLDDNETINGSKWTVVPNGTVKPGGGNGSLYLTGRLENGTAALAPTTILQPDLTTYRFGRSGVWLRFFTVVPSTNIAGDVTTLSAPRAVSYQMLRKQIGTTNAYSYRLYRAEVRPGSTASTSGNSTFDLGYNLFMSKTATPSYNKPDITLDGNAGNIRSPLDVQLIANNVIDFGVRLWSNSSTVIFPTSSTHLGLAVTSSSVVFGPDGVGVTNNAYPVTAECFIRILTDEGARLIDSFEQGFITQPAGMSKEDYWWQLAEGYSNVYTRKIDIKSTSL